MDFDDDAFGELVYEDEDYEQALENKKKQDPNCTSTQEEDEEDHRDVINDILPELSDDDDTVNNRCEFAGDRKENANEEHKLLDRAMGIGQQQMGRKRGPIGGVFNDYSPIDWHLRIGDEEQQTKRRRTELEEAVQRVTMRILSARRQNQHQRQQHQDEFMLPSQLGVRKHKLLHVPPMNGQMWWGINSVDGTFRRYLGTRRQPKEIATKTTNAAQMESADAALAKLIQAEERVHEWEQQQQRLRNNNRSVQIEIDGLRPSQNVTAKKVSKFALWADKYAPNTFLDLLTEDETNRIVLLWLRLWDEYVFESREGKKVMGGLPRRKRHRNANANSASLWDTLEERDRTLFEMERPKGTDSRIPKQKILTLFGPSGVGKTSLARVAAVQAGYQPVTIPISELQNMAELKSRLENATDCTSIDALFHNLSVSAPSEDGALQPPSHAGTRPCCFIVDAVEQASPEMIQFLCSWVRRSHVSSTVRRRPVICTCASLWHAPALRELRAHCLSVRVQRCNRQRMQRRLEQICLCEGVRISRDQLDELFLSHGNDIRLCLNTLQFSALKRQTFQPNRINSTNTTTPNANFAFVSGGAADQQKVPSSSSVPSPLNSAVTASLFDTLSAIFTLDFHADNRGIVRPLPVRSRTLQILFGQMPTEDFGRLQQLVFNNFATVLKLNMAQCRFVASLFTELDALQTLVQRAQHFVLARYIPFALAFVHFHCALHVSRRLQFNLAVQSFVEQQRENQQVMRSLRANLLTAANRCIGLAELFTWFVPLLWFVLQPRVKPSLWSDGGGDGHEQRQMVQRVVDLMRSFGISLVRTTGADGVARLAFEPAFDSLVRFPTQMSIGSSESVSNGITTTTPTATNTAMHLVSESVKQYIAQQLEQTLLMAKKQQHTVHQPKQQQQQTDRKDIDKYRGSGQCHQNWMIDRRPVSPSSSALSVQQPLFTFRHSAGSSQAVRRDIRIGTLFSIF